MSHSWLNYCDVRGSCNILKVVIKHQTLTVLCDPLCVTSDRVKLPSPGEVPGHFLLEPEPILIHWNMCFEGYPTPGLRLWPSLWLRDFEIATIKSHHWIPGAWLCIFPLLSFLYLFSFPLYIFLGVIFMLLDCCFSNQNGYKYLVLPQCSKVCK